MYHDIGCYWIPGGGNIGDLTPNIGSNALLLLLYVLFGVGFPLVFIWGFRKVKRAILFLK